MTDAPGSPNQPVQPSLIPEPEQPAEPSQAAVDEAIVISENAAAISATPGPGLPPEAAEVTFEHVEGALEPDPASPAPVAPAPTAPVTPVPVAPVAVGPVAVAPDPDPTAPAPDLPAPRTADPSVPGPKAPDPTAWADANLTAASSLGATSWMATWFLIFGLLSAAMAVLFGYLPSPARWVIPAVIWVVALLVLFRWAVGHRATVMTYRSTSAGFWLGWAVIWVLMLVFGLGVGSLPAFEVSWWIGAIALAGLGYGISVSLRRKAQEDADADFRITGSR